MLRCVAGIVLLKRLIPLASLKNNSEVLYSQAQTILSVFCFVGQRLTVLLAQIFWGTILQFNTINLNSSCPFKCKHLRKKEKKRKITFP